MWWIDKIVTGLIIGWAAASIFGFSRSKKWKKIWEKVLWIATKHGKTWVSIFWKITVKLISLFQKK